MKFLGLKYNFHTKLFKGATKNGSTLEFGEDQLAVLKLIRMQRDYVSLMEALVNSGI